jgi:tRNA(fMet)-specific endonuclease VapC
VCSSDLDRDRKRRALNKVDSLVGRGERIVTTRVNLAELYVGIELSDNPEREYTRIRNIVDHVDAVLELDDPAAQAFGQIVAHLRRLGRPPGDLDVLIAAIALENGHCLVTLNPSHFADIPCLRVESY